MPKAIQTDNANSTSSQPYTITSHSSSQISTGMTSLHHAAKIGNLARCKALIAQGVNVDALAQDGHTPLHIAAINGHV